MPARRQKIPEKDQQDPLHRPAGDAVEPHQLPAAPAGPGRSSVARSLLTWTRIPRFLC